MYNFTVFFPAKYFTYYTSPFLPSLQKAIFPIKGIVQRKPGWAESGDNRQILFSVGVLDIFILFLRTTILDFAKNVEPKLLVMSERINEALKMVCSAYQFVITWYQRQQECRQILNSSSWYLFCLTNQRWRALAPNYCVQHTLYRQSYWCWKVCSTWYTSYQRFTNSFTHYQ